MSDPLSENGTSETLPFYMNIVFGLENDLFTRVIEFG